MATINDLPEALRDYAVELIDAGFTVYAAGPNWNFMHYLEPQGRYYGTISKSEFEGWGHSMPIKPSHEFGSGMYIDEADARVDPFTVKAARDTARAFNTNRAVGTQPNGKPSDSQVADDRIVERPAPTVGTPVTLIYPQDLYGYTIVRVSDSGKTAWMIQMPEVNKNTPGQPAYMNGPWPVYDHTYPREECLAVAEAHNATETGYGERRISQRKDGNWRVANTTIPVRLSVARYRRDYSL